MKTTFLIVLVTVVAILFGTVFTVTAERDSVAVRMVGACMICRTDQIIRAEREAVSFLP